MLTEVKRVGILRAGTLGAILYGFLGVLMLPLALIAVIADPVEGPEFRKGVPAATKRTET